MRTFAALFAVAAALLAGSLPQALGGYAGEVLKAENFKHYIDAFNANDRELYPQHIRNAAAWEFLATNMPLFECPDKDVEEIYYFRWWTYRKHLKQTPDGFILTEFLPKVGWAGKHNSISCAAGHHFYEGRWLRDPKYLDDYAVFWFRKGGEPRRYSFWAADAMWSRYLVTGSKALVLDLLPDLVRNYEAWEKERLLPDGLFWQNDGQDGGEMSIGGSGLRATINSYMYGDAVAISRIAELAGKADLAAQYREKAARLKRLVQERLWDPEAQFFKVLPRGEGARFADVRELYGFTPWYFNLPDPPYAVAWKQVMDPQGFYAPFGPTTAEQRHPKFAVSYQGHECQWNGPSWPYATAVTLTAMANLLNGPPQTAVGRKDYFDLLKIYTRCHRLTLDDGRTVPWIDENLNPATGDWIARTRLKTWKNGTWDPGKGGEERGKDYNHSSYCDLIISGLVGLRTRADDTVEVNPLVPDGKWGWFCLDNVWYHGRILTIVWDKDGTRYGKRKGLRVLADGKEIAMSERLTRVGGKLPAARAARAPGPAGSTSGGWVKSDSSSPVLGGKRGTCFDVALLKEGNKFRLWFSWRPKASVALTESPDGIHWSDPAIVLTPNKATGWEDDINRPAVIKRGDGYHMWYTGQARGHSRIGYATSPDGKTWTKHAANPVFAADPKSAWEKHKVTACQVVRHGEWHLMFYVGFRDNDHAQIGLAHSKDGIGGWERLAANPIIRPGENQWDHDACYKPFAIFDGGRWRLWYNGRRGNVEQIGLAIHEGEDLGFEEPSASPSRRGERRERPKACC